MKLILSFFLLFIIKSLNAKAYSKVNRELGIKYNEFEKSFRRLQAARYYQADPPTIEHIDNDETNDLDEETFQSTTNAENVGESDIEFNDLLMKNKNTQENFELRLKTLLIAKNKNEVTLPRLYLQGVSTDFDIAENFSTYSKSSFSSIVISNSYNLSLDEWKEIRNYCDKYNIRLVVLNSEPSLLGVNYIEINGDQEKTMLSFTPQAKEKELQGIMCEQCTWSMNGINPIRAVKGDNLEDFLPLLEVKSPNTHGVVAAIFKKGNHEEMHFFFNTLLLEVENDFGTLNFVQRYEYTKLNLALGNLWFEWVTKGIYLGKRRIFLCIHIDDFFAATQIYRSTDFRIGEDAVHAAVEWIQATNQRLPSGSNVRFELAYNGAGYEALNFEPSKGAGLSAAAESFKWFFYWVSHTWTHQNLDWLEPEECSKGEDVCQTSINRIEWELDANIKLIKGEPIYFSDMKEHFKNGEMNNTTKNIFFKNEPDGLRMLYSPNSLVPPEISGLWPASAKAPSDRIPRALPKNTKILKVLKSRNITTVTGDNSRKELLSQKNPHHGVYTSIRDYGVEGILIIPRWAVNVFYDTKDPHSYMKEYNEKKACLWSDGPPCPKSGHQSFEEAILRQAKATTAPWLQFRADPFMFHQANMNPFKYKNKNQSLVSLWADESLNLLLQYINKLPIVSIKMDDLGNFFRARMRRDNCDIEAFAKFSNNEIQSVRIKGGNDNQSECVAVLTVIKKIFEFKNNNEHVVEEYGPERTIEVYIKYGETSTVEIGKK